MKENEISRIIASEFAKRVECGGVAGMLGGSFFNAKTQRRQAATPVDNAVRALWTQPGISASSQAESGRELKANHAKISPRLRAACVFALKKEPTYGGKRN